MGRQKKRESIVQTIKTVFLAATVLLGGCASPSQMLVGPQGDIRRCAASGWGWAGAPLAKHSVNNCVADLQNVGYLLAEEAGAVGIQLSDASPVTVTVVKPDSPANKAGILIGDQIVKIDGQQVLDRAAARTMMFGKAGTTVTFTMNRNGTEMVFQIVRAPRVATSS